MAAKAQDPPAAGPNFEDFDDPQVFEATRELAFAETCRNFVLEFGAEKAVIARDLEKEQFQHLLLQPERNPQHPIRWINIWDTSAQKDIVKLLGGKYSFSERLISLMVFASEMNRQTAKKTAAAATATPAGAAKTADPEKGIPNGSSASTSEDHSAPVLEGEEIELYYLLKDTVNYSSIDRTERAFCVGAHWLYKRTQKEPAAEQAFMPPKHWLWLTLCDDHTIITFHEYPVIEPAPKGEDEKEWRLAHLRSMRANSLDVLLQQSVCGMEMYKRRPLSQNSIREALRKALHRDSSHAGRPALSRIQSDVPPLGSNPAITLEHEGTSRLFYYLFEDYAAAGPLKAAGKILEEMTPKVLDSAKRRSRVRSSEIIPRLHILSRDLRTLQHLFNNYKILISKIIMSAQADAQNGGGGGQRNSAFGGSLATISRIGADLMGEDYFGSGEDHHSLPSLDHRDEFGGRIFLTQSALQRFDRLRVRIQGLMLNTIDGHLEEIKALSETYFNLTQQKDSAATARLTRSATLLAKLSVFFLPISFMTSYFSVQIEDLYIYWTAGTYWYAFAVIATLSFIGLFFFGRLLMFFSDALDDWSAAISDWCRAVVHRLVGIKLEDKDDEED